ncbi:MAG: ATP-dependent Clp protease ATP-binding subunit, partial [Clostridia bacterium]|nr:ATP-dependent Clp protease ATP-binding subunit [Clostridia bacterium]
MDMPVCARCKKNMAVVFITKIENGTSVNEGLCLKCAKELGIKPVSDLLDKFGLKDSDLDGLTPEALGESLPSVMEQMGMMPMDALPEEDDGEDTPSRAPAFPLFNLFRQNGKQEEKASEKPEEGGKKPKNKKKFLNNYAMDLTAKAREGKLDRVVGRESETLRVIQILNRRQKNNPCLIGEP